MDEKCSLKSRLIHIKALIIKEFYQILRDPSSILISFILPAILLFIYGFGVSLDIKNLRIGLVLEDTNPDARSFAEALTNSKYFKVKIARDRRELIPDLISGSIRGIVVVPSYFSEFRDLKNHDAPILVITDGSETNTANFVSGYVTGAWLDWLEQERISSGLTGLPRINVQQRYWYNEKIESTDFLIPGSIAIIMTLIGTLLTSLVIASEWERGTMESLMSTPVTISDILIAKLIPYFILGMLSMTFCVLGAIFVYNVPLRGSFLVLAFATGCFLISALGLGLLISSLARNQLVAAQAAIVVAFLPAYIMSGFLFEITSMPLPIRMLTYLFPAKYFVTILQTLFLVGNVWRLIIVNIIPMLLIGAVFYLIIIKKTVKRLD